MRIAIREIRKAVRAALLEASTEWASPPAPAGRGNLYVSVNSRSREQMEKMSDQEIRREEMASHLEDEVDGDNQGPVPRTAENPYVMQDPFVRSSSPNPRPAIYR